MSRAYVLVDRSRNCIVGNIVSVGNDAVVIKTLSEGPRGRWVNKEITIKRGDVLRIGERAELPDVIYSGRSSWADVSALRKIAGGEYVLAIDKNGREQKGKLARASKEALTLKGLTSATTVSKSAIGQVFYVRYKPVSASVEWSAQELFFDDPRLWPYLVHVAPKMRVLLFDSSLPENDSPVACKKR